MGGGGGGGLGSLRAFGFQGFEVGMSRDQGFGWGALECRAEARHAILEPNRTG